MLSDTIRTWPYSSKPVGGKLLDHWADEVVELKAENERLRHAIARAIEQIAWEGDYGATDTLMRALDA